MKKKIPFNGVFLILFIFSQGMIPASSSDLPLGLFSSQVDVGDPTLKGSTFYDSEKQSYTLTGAGTNMWSTEDEFQFAWKKIKGDFIVRTRAYFPEKGVMEHRKYGWMARSTLDKGSPHVNAVVHGDGLTSLQFRHCAGGETKGIKSEIIGAEVVQLERKGNRFTMSVAKFGQPFVVSDIETLELGPELYVGLFVCSHKADVIEKAVFEDVRITIPEPEGLVPYRDYLGSRLETLDMETGKRRILYETTEGIEAPNWTPDGSTLIYNSRGKMYRFPLAENKPYILETGVGLKCNNDHVISPDGKTLGISAKKPGGQSLIYTIPVEGGTPQQVTAEAPSYLHGWSPDGTTLIYTAKRNGEFDIYSIPATGGEETRLTTAEGLDDGSEYSPDGNWIYFNSARTGTMQIWRMKPDGSDQEQLTHDVFNNWFPHVSPDGKRIVFISFSKDIAADDHPYYQHVYLRTMPISGGETSIIAYIYGGQGTINVPSWSPDSRHVAFVSHTHTGE